MITYTQKKIICNSMGIVQFEIVGTKDSVEETWKSMEVFIDKDLCIYDFYYGSGPLITEHSK